MPRFIGTDKPDGAGTTYPFMRNPSIKELRIGHPELIQEWVPKSIRIS